MNRDNVGSRIRTTTGQTTHNISLPNGMHQNYLHEVCIITMMIYEALEQYSKDHGYYCCYS